MDALRLLSRSSGLKLRPQDSTNVPPVIPSAAGVSGTKPCNETTASKKRKRDDVQGSSGHAQEHCHAQARLSTAEIRSIQKQHKIKITDLKAFHADRKSPAASATSRKAQKEGSRLFPQPLRSFSQLRRHGVVSALVSNIADQAYKEPTEVQLAVIPLLLSSSSLTPDQHITKEKEDQGPDLITVAPTGSGKTVAFLVPLIDKIRKLHQASVDKDRHVCALILAPTKELAAQIANEGRKLVPHTGVRISELRKGMRLHDLEQIRGTGGSASGLDVDSSSGSGSGSGSGSDSDSGSDSGSDLGSDSGSDSGSGIDQAVGATVVKSDIIVATPLSLLNVIIPQASTMPLPLPSVTTLVLDEADVLLDPLFREQTLAIWKACNSPDLRTSLWSATVGSSIEELAISTINDRHQRCSIAANDDFSPPLIRVVIGLKDTSLPTISHRLIYASTETGKLMGLRQLIHPAPDTAFKPHAPSLTPQTNTTPPTPIRPPFLVFTQTIDRAISLHRELQYEISPSAGGPSRVAALHSGLTARQRAETMTRFRQGKIWILITTDLLSRGVDFRGVNAVINYDIPTTAAAYVHRAGRTGRAGRQGGICVTLYTKEDITYLKPIANMIQASISASTYASTANNNKTTAAAQDQYHRKDPAISTQIPQLEGGLPDWLLPSLPTVAKTARKQLKKRGVDVRRAISRDDDERSRRRKLKNRIGTGSGGFEKRMHDRRVDMAEGSRRRQEKQEREREREQKQGSTPGQTDRFDGFED